jgi:sensor histidine kinase YesM
MRNKISTYWWCQILGWSSYTLVWTFFYFAIRSKPQPFFFQSLFTDAILGLLITHIMRMVIKGFDLLRFDLQKQIFLLVITALVFALIDSLVFVSIIGLFNWELPQLKQYSFGNRVARALLTTFLFYLIWNFIYFTYHYIQKSRRDELDKIRLQSLVKELELKTIKSHINPHFIFNALNSIRALVDENPQRARTAITELSNILRSSMHSEKLELAPFERELNIVKDYLALEHIRFEERLQVEYDIDEDTLDQPIPPMMLQTLVENAIKHGISQQRNGGTIKIISDFIENHHELIVQNTGTLNAENNTEGFGITSTQTRLNLLYGKEAKLELNAITHNMVEAKVILPVQLEKNIFK